MKERYFASEVVRSLRHFGCWAYKIPDPLSYEVRRTMPRPFDILFVGKYSGGLELKVARPGIRLEQHQVKALRAVARSGGVAGVLVYAGRCEAYFVPVSVLRLSRMGHLGSKALRRDGILIRKERGVWDFSKVFEKWSGVRRVAS